MWTGKNLKDLVRSVIPVNWAGYFLMAGYVVLSLAELFLNHFPSTKTFKVKEYRQNINSQTQANDLLIVSDSRSYMYARSIYKKNLQNIIADSRISGIKLLTNKSLNIEDYKVKTPNGFLPVFLDWQGRSSSTRVSKTGK